MSTRLGKFTLVVLKSTDKTRLCVTQRGYIGLVPNEARVGDQLCVLLGGKVPYILRSVVNKSSTGYDHDSRMTCHLFIAECYVNCLMNGEAMDNLEKEKFEL